MRGQAMRWQWRLKDVMGLVAVLAIYLAGVHFLTLEPSRDPVTAFSQIISFVLVTEQIVGAICERLERATMVALDPIVFFRSPI